MKKFNLKAPIIQKSVTDAFKKETGLDTDSIFYEYSYINYNHDCNWRFSIMYREKVNETTRLLQGFYSTKDHEISSLWDKPFYDASLQKHHEEKLSDQWKNILFNKKESRISQFSLSNEKDPRMFIQGIFKDELYEFINDYDYRSPRILNPTYENAWYYFKKSQWAKMRKLESLMDHIYLEGVKVDNENNTIRFITGS